MSTTPSAAIRIGLAGLVWIVGCASPGSEQVDEGGDVMVEYGPAEAYEPFEYETGVRMSDFGISGPDDSLSGVQLLNDEATNGRFPTGLAVVRVHASSRDEGPERPLFVSAMGSDRAVYWNGVVDDLPSVREVTILRTLGIDPRGGTWSDLTREALNVACDLCLMYGAVANTDADAEFIAVLWDAAQQTPLSFFRAATELSPEVRKRCKKKRAGHDRECDAAFLAEARLRTMVRDHLWDLAQRDSTSVTTQPSPWRTDLPLFPRDYYRYRDPRSYPPRRSGS